MSLQFLPYTQDAVPAVREFNQRLLAGGAPADQQFPETPDPGWMPGMELFLAVEGSIVRGGYILRRQTFSAAGATVPVGHYRLPLSEGIVNRSYATLGLSMVRDALAREPRLYAMGMGGWEKPLPQMLKRLTLEDVRGPFPLQGGPSGAIPAPYSRAPYQSRCAAPHWTPPPSPAPAGWA